MDNKGTLTSPSTSKDTNLQDRYNQEIADKYNSLVQQLTEIPTGLDAAGIISYLQDLKV